MDITPVPPQDFVRKLNRYDPDLLICWEMAQRVWSLRHRDTLTGRVSHVMSVVEPDGSYRPLDARVFLDLDKARYFAQNPKELEKLVVDDELAKLDKEAADVHKDMEYVSKDKQLNKKWNEIKDKVASLPRSIVESLPERGDDMEIVTKCGNKIETMGV